MRLEVVSRCAINNTERSWTELHRDGRVGHGSLFQNPTQPIIDTWYGILGLGYTANFIQQLYTSQTS